jgi:hypothetical protein
MALVVLGAAGSTVIAGRQGGEQYIGTWTGTWEGNGNGGFELTLERGTDAALGGRVSVTGEPTYEATLKRVAFEGSKMTANYDFPPAEGIQVTLTATFDDKKAAGTWRAHDAGGADLASGTWEVARK